MFIPIQCFFWRYPGTHHFQTNPNGGYVFMTLNYGVEKTSAGAGRRTNIIFDAMWPWIEIYRSICLLVDKHPYINGHFPPFIDELQLRTTFFNRIVNCHS